MTNSMLSILAAASTASADAPPAWFNLIPFIGMFAVLWFLILRPQMRRQKEHQAKIGGIKKGDQVVTGGDLAVVHHARCVSGCGALAVRGEWAAVAQRAAQSAS